MRFLVGKKGSWDIFLNTKKELLIRAVKDPRKKDAYLLTFENKLTKKDAVNVLDICGEIFEKEKVKTDKDYVTLFEVKSNKVKRKN